MTISDFVCQQRKNYKLTQRDWADKSGVGLRFVRDSEAGNLTLHLDKVNTEQDLFGAKPGVVPAKEEK